MRKRTYRDCYLSFECDLDKGRINDAKRVVDEATPNSPRKIYFGCDPKNISKLWKLLETRAAEVGRGVVYPYLVSDRFYLPPADAK
jgi:hypothetical protein